MPISGSSSSFPTGFIPGPMEHQMLRVAKWYPITVSLLKTVRLPFKPPSKWYALNSTHLLFPSLTLTLYVQNPDKRHVVLTLEPKDSSSQSKFKG